MTIATPHHARRVAASLGSVLLALVFVLCGCSQERKSAEITEEEKSSEEAIGTVGTVAPTIVDGGKKPPLVTDASGVVAWQEVYSDVISDLTIANTDLAPDAVSTGKVLGGTLLPGDIAPSPAPLVRQQLTSGGATVFWDDDGLTLPLSEIDPSTGMTSFEIIKSGTTSGAIRGVVQNGTDDWSAVDGVTDGSGAGVRGVAAPPSNPWTTLQAEGMGRVLYDSVYVDETILADDVAVGAVTTREILNETVLSEDLLSRTTTPANIANRPVTNAKPSPDAVTTDKALVGVSINGDLATNAVDSRVILNESIMSKDIRDQQTMSVDIPPSEPKVVAPPIVQAPPIYENPFRSSQHSPYSTFGIDVDNASYTNVRGYLMRGQQPPAAAVRIEEMINYFEYDYPEPTDHHPFAFDSEVVTCPWNRDHLLVRLALQGRDIHPAQAPPSNLVFLIDVSGSMSDANKLPLLKQSFHLLVEQLRAQDRVAIVVYAGAAGTVLESTPGSEKETIHQAIDNLEAGGSTAGGAGIRRAYGVALENFMSEGNNRVILATDGDFNVGVSSEEGLVKLIEEKREDGVFLSVLGFGHGNYQDRKMEQLADNGNGNYYYIDRLEEGSRVLAGEMSGTLYTIAKDVKLQVDFNAEKVAAYRLIGYENRVLAARDFNDDTKDAGELGAGHQVTALYEVVPVGATVGHTIDTIHVACERLDEELPNLFTAHDLLRARLRYKNPKENVSNLIEHLIQDDRKEIAAASPSTRLAAAIAAWGMSLRSSVYDGDVDLATVGSWLPAEMPDRAEIVGLMEKSGNDVASSE